MEKCPHPPARQHCQLGADVSSLTQHEIRYYGIAWIACCDCGELIYLSPELQAIEDEWEAQHESFEQRWQERVPGEAA